MSNLSLFAAASKIAKKVGETLLIGDSQLGYYGEIPASQLIDGISLANSIGLSQGTPINNDQGWLKFSHLGKILYIAKKPMRKSASWNSISTAGAADGTKTVTIANKTYKVRLLTGSAAGEFDTLIYRTHKNGGKLPAFDKFSSADLGLGSSGAAFYTLCQEIMFGVPTWRIARNDVPSSHTNVVTDDTADYVGWRPVLELIE